MIQTRGACLQRLVERTVDRHKIFGTTLCVFDRKRNHRWCGAAGELSVETPYFTASTTKLYITALILILESEGRISLLDPIHRYLSEEFAEDLDPRIQIIHLLAHTSGLTDYFQSKPKLGKSLETRVTSGEDLAWTTADAIAMSQKMGSQFVVGTPNRAHYSDTNYQLLGRIIETIERAELTDILKKRIFDPLSLKHTYLYQDPNDPRPADLYFKKTKLHIPHSMVSFGADGGIVSTAEEGLIFIQAFFEGALFPSRRIESLRQWNRIFFPLEYGIGIMKFQLPWIFSPFRRLPTFIGHSGLSGAFAFYCKEKDIYLSGTVNQIASPSTSFRLMLRVADLF